MKVLKIFEETPQQHMSAEDIFMKLQGQEEDIGLATIYRVLAQFEAAGLIKRHNFEGTHAIFELNQGEHHDHLVCVRCDRVVEFVDEIIENRQEQIAEQTNFKITHHNHTIYGYCETCRD